MNLLSEKELTEAILRMPVGSQTFYTTGPSMKAVAEKFINIDFRQYDLNEFKVSKSDTSKMSAKREIEIACANCDESNVLLNHDIRYVRVIVSQFNRTHGCKVLVRKVGDGIIVTADPQSKPWIRKEEYDAIKLEYEAKLSELRRKVRTDEFFDMLSPQFKNGLPFDTLGESIDEATEVEFEDEQHDPSIFVTKPVEAQTTPPPVIENWKLAECPECGEEFTTLNADQLWCNDCIERADEDIL